MSKKKVRLAILGTGGMANVHAEKFAAIPGCTIVAAADVDLQRAKDFAAKHNIPAAYAGVKELLKKADFDAVTIVAPDAFHAPLSIACLKADKHVLCEKPLAVTYPDARKMVAAATKAGVINMVNLSYRDWPAIQAVEKVIRSGEIGEVRHIEASYLQAWLASKVWGDWRTTPAWLWRLSSKHGSKGVLGDVGVHIVDFATYPVGPLKSVYCRLKTFPKAKGDRIGEYVLDANDSAVLNVEFANGAIGTIPPPAGAEAMPTGFSSRSRAPRERWKSILTKPLRLSHLLGSRSRQGPVAGRRGPAMPNNYQRFIKAIQTGRQDQPDFARGAKCRRCSMPATSPTRSRSRSASSRPLNPKELHAGTA